MSNGLRQPESFSPRAAPDRRNPRGLDPWVDPRASGGVQAAHHQAGNDAYFMDHWGADEAPEQPRMVGQNQQQTIRRRRNRSGIRRNQPIMRRVVPQQLHFQPLRPLQVHNPSMMVQGDAPPNGGIADPSSDPLKSVCDGLAAMCQEWRAMDQETDQKVQEAANTLQGLVDHLAEFRMQLIDEEEQHKEQLGLLINQLHPGDAA